MLGFLKLYKYGEYWKKNTVSFRLVAFVGLFALIIFHSVHVLFLGFPGGSVRKDSSANAGDVSSVPGLGRSPGERNGNQPTPVFLPGKSHGQRSLMGYSPWVTKSQT